MALNIRLVTELVRQRLNLPDDSQYARIAEAVPEALKSVSRKIAADQWLRQLLCTNPDTTTYPLDVNSQISLINGYNDYQFLMEYFDKGLLYLLPTLVSIVRSECQEGLIIDPYVSGYANGDIVYFTVNETGVLFSGITADTPYTIADLNTETGEFRLTEGVDDCNEPIYIDILDEGTPIIYMTRQDASNGLPMQEIAYLGGAGLPQYLSSNFTYFCRQRDMLSVVPATTGSVAFNVPTFAKTLADLPNSEEVEQLFIQEITNLVAIPTVEAN